MNPELISIGSCTLDVMIDIDDILRFELMDKNVRFIPGGSGANIAANCSMLGLNSVYIGILGNDFSATICLDDLRKRGVDLSQIVQTDEDSTALSVILRTPWGKDRSILAYKGANNLLKPSDVKPELFENIKAFAWTSLTTDDGCQAIDKAIKLTKVHGGKVIAAPSMSIIKNSPSWAKTLISQSDIVSLNKDEAKEFTGEKKNSIMIKKFIDLGIKLISITDGPNGSIISDGDTIINSSIFEGSIEDTTGAGDAFLCGILIATLNNFPLEKTSKMATAMAALECMEVGVREGLPNSLQELEDFINNNQLKQVISKIV